MVFLLFVLVGIVVWIAVALATGLLVGRGISVADRREPHGGTLPALER